MFGEVIAFYLDSLDHFRVFFQRGYQQVQLDIRLRKLLLNVKQHACRAISGPTEVRNLGKNNFEQ